MSTPTRIREVRVSLIWFERWGDIWSADKPIAMEFTRSAAGYAKEYDQMLNDTVKTVLANKPVPKSRLESTALTPPWPFQKPEYPHWFWRFYLGRSPGATNSALALRKLAPFRTGFPAAVRAQKKWIALMIDAFIYPHGIGLMPTLRLSFDRGEWPAGGVQTSLAMRSVLTACNDPVYEIAWNGGNPATTVKLTGVVDDLMNHLRDRVLGPDAVAGERTQLPFSVAAVIRGDTDVITSAPPETGDIHHLLQGLCSFSKSWEDDKLAPYKDALLRLRRSAPEGHLVYHTGRSRAVWFPASFTKTGAYNRSCGCYQRNLALLHLQTEALLQALAVRQDLSEEGTKVPDFPAQLAKNAATQISTIYASSDATYQSSSARAFLDETPSQKQLVNDALKNDGKDALKYEPWPHSS